MTSSLILTTMPGYDDLPDTPLSVLGLLLALSLISIVLQVRNRRLQNKLGIEAAENEKLQQTLRELTDKLNFKDKLLYVVAHDVKGPVSSLITYIDLVSQETEIPQALVPVKDTIVLQLTTVYNLLSNMLQWSEKGMEKEWEKKEMFNLSELVQNNINLISGYVQVKGLTVCNQAPPDIMMHGVKNEIDIVIRNLLFNALKFTPRGGYIQILVSEQPSSIQLAVKDNGVGMSAEIIAHLFDRKREFKTTIGTNGERGSGLGLTMCKQLVTKNGGTIHAESEEGKGSKMVMQFPQASFAYL